MSRQWGRMLLTFNETKGRYDKTPHCGTLDRPYELSFLNKDQLKTLPEVLKDIEMIPGKLYVPAYAQWKGSKLWSADIDDCLDPNNGTLIKNDNGKAGEYSIRIFKGTYIERSVSKTGLHVLFWWTGKGNPVIETTECDPSLITLKDQGWLTFTGDLYSPDISPSINDLTDELQEVVTSSPTTDKNYSPLFYKVPDAVGVGNREPTIYRLTWSLAEKNLHFSSILACILEENKHFVKPHTEEYVRKKVSESYTAHIKKVSTEKPIQKNVINRLLMNTNNMRLKK